MGTDLEMVREKPARDEVDGSPPDPYPTALTARQRRTLWYLSIIGLTVPFAVTVFVLIINSVDPVTMKQFWFFVHLGCGVVIIHGFAGGLATLVTRRTSRLREAVRLTSTASMAVVSWITVISGTWLVYPGYRATLPPGGDADIRAYPVEWLVANDMWLWHGFGMEWKEHVGFLTPILATAVAFVAYRYSELVNRNHLVRALTVTFFAVAFLAALIAAALGAGLNAVVPNDFLRI